MKFNNWYSAILTFACFVSLNFFSACDDDDQVQECNNGNYDELQWLQDVKAELDKDGRPESRIEVYEYNGQVMFFGIPSDDPSFSIPCILYTCNGAQVCEFSDASNTCQDFFERGDFREVYWSKN